MKTVGWFASAIVLVTAGAVAGNMIINAVQKARAANSSSSTTTGGTQ